MYICYHYQFPQKCVVVSFEEIVSELMLNIIGTYFCTLFVQNWIFYIFQVIILINVYIKWFQHYSIYLSALRLFLPIRWFEWCVCKCAKLFLLRHGCEYDLSNQIEENPISERISFQNKSHWDAHLFEKFVRNKCVYFMYSLRSHCNVRIERQFRILEYVQHKNDQMLTI